MTLQVALLSTLEVPCRTFSTKSENSADKSGKLLWTCESNIIALHVTGNLQFGFIRSWKVPAHLPTNYVTGAPTMLLDFFLLLFKRYMHIFFICWIPNEHITHGRRSFWDYDSISVIISASSHVAETVRNAVVSRRRCSSAVFETKLQNFLLIGTVFRLCRKSITELL